MHKSPKPDKSIVNYISERIPALIAVYNIHTGEYLYVNEGLYKILGYKPEKFLNGGIKFASSIIHPDDLPRIMDKNLKALKQANKKASKKTPDEPIVNFEYRMRHKNGNWIWLQTSGSVFSRDVKGMVENIMNISIDITERKNKEQHTLNELKDSEVRYRSFITRSTEGIWRFELEKPLNTGLSVKHQIDHLYNHAYIAECNKAIAKMHGFKNVDEICGSRLGIVFSKSDPDSIAFLGSFIKSGYNISNSVLTKFDKNRRIVTLENNLVGVLKNGRLLRFWGTERNITKEHISTKRLEFLEKVGRTLAVSIDQTVTLQEITRLVISYLADYCRIVTIDEKNGITEIAANHLDPTKVTLVKDLYDSYKNDSKATYGIPTLLTKGKPELISVVDDNFLQKSKVNEETVKIVKKIGLKSYMGFPLKARNKIIGAITFSSVKEGRYYSKEDLEFARILVSRISLTIDNAKLYADAQRAIAVRENFISIASHELRTPVTSLKIYADLLQREIGNTAQKKPLLAKIHSQINKLTKLVGDLLDISRIQSGKLEFKFEKFDLTNCINEIVEDFRNLYKGAEIKVIGKIRKKVYADRNRIEQVIVNLLNNAIKYSPKEKRVIVHLQEKSNKAVVDVEDFGIGIDKEHRKKIFERFYRVNMKQETFPGLGIGLYISREIIKRHEGSIKAANKESGGSIFSFSIPFQK